MEIDNGGLNQFFEGDGTASQERGASEGERRGFETWRHRILDLVLGSLADSCHGDAKTTLNRLEGIVWWGKMGNDSEFWCRAGTSCTAKRGQVVVSRIHLIRRRGGFREIQVDLVGPINPPSEEGCRWVFMVVCVHSKPQPSRPCARACEFLCARVYVR